MSVRRTARTAASLLCVALCVRAQWSGAAARTGERRTDRALNGTVFLHDYMMFLYRTLSTLQPADTHAAGRAGFANTVTSFVDQGKDLPSWESGQRYIFDLSSLVRVEQLVEAELRILRKPPTDLLTALTTGGNLYNIRLYSCSPEGASERQLLDSRTVEVLDGGLPRWEVFDVWFSMKARLRNPTDPPQACFHLQAISELTNEVADPLLLGLGRHARPPPEKALLVTFLHTDTSGNLFTEIMEKRLQVPQKPAPTREKKKRGHGRRAVSKRSFGASGRRAAAGKRSGRRRTRCGRKPLHVSFKDLGWDDWIIAPLDYEAHHCEGVCDFPLRAHLEPTNHAVIQTLMNSIDPDISPPSCCVPSKLSPISILYIDSGGNVVYKQYEDMVVESCGCW
ncbi:growth/differentiation factor 6-A [Salarias fasciatus]|uniref:growth/differentiation factor 6-A n=1 Tax=Salarias fasciatus TaxID=181472 RepID=UPI001176639A|nr:growth/differentiation factor 6-A-like [Salarias fasciatus]